MTRNGALAGMVTGFVCVPFFKFIPGMLLRRTEWIVLEWLNALAELPPAFALSACAIVLVSILDKAGQAKLSHTQAHLEEASRPFEVF